MKTTREKYDELARKRKQAEAPAGREAADKQHARGKRTAIERVEALIDPGSLTEFDRFVTHRTNAFGLDEKEFLGDGVVTGGRRSTAAKSSSSLKTSRCSADRWVKPTPRKFAR